MMTDNLLTRDFRTFKEICDFTFTQIFIAIKLLLIHFISVTSKWMTFTFSKVMFLYDILTFIQDFLLKTYKTVYAAHSTGRLII